MSALAELIAETVLSVIVWIVLLPFFLIVSTPVILVTAAWQATPPSYWSHAADMYVSVIAAWLELWKYL